MHTASELTPDRKIKVAVLDDDIEMLRSVSSVLQAMGFDAHSYQDPTELLSNVQSQGFDAFVFDWILEGTTARPVIEQVRTGSQCSNAPIFVLSGNLSMSGVPADDSMATTIHNYDIEYRLKPYPVSKLAREIQQRLGRTPA